MFHNPRIRAALFHLLASLLLALMAAALVFGLWYPSPYAELAGGRNLFFIVVFADVVCGPVLTLVLFNPTKRVAELTRDLGLVALIQLVALGYGLHTVWQARPLYLVQEVDRFKVIAAPDLAEGSLRGLSSQLQPNWWQGPIPVAIRSPKDENERREILFESALGGRDYAERPEFYLPYEGLAALKSLQHAKPLTTFLEKQPSQLVLAKQLASQKTADLDTLLYLPVVGRQDWVAVLDRQGLIQGFLRGDGF